MQASRYLRLPPSFDIARLQADLAAIDDADWIPHANTAAYNGVWRCLPLRAVGGRSDHILSLPGEAYADTPLLARCPYLRQVIDSFHCDKGSVRLMAMAPGARIHVHRDHGTAFEDGTARLHIPIITDPAVLFSIEDEAVHFTAGGCWYLNADCRHGVRNDSRIARIHLMMDCSVNTWLQALFDEAGFVARPAPRYGDPSIHDANVADVIAGLRAMGTKAGQQHAERLERIRQQWAES